MFSVKETFCTFCKRTSLHGWQFLDRNEKSSLETCKLLYWLVAVLVSLMFGISYMVFHIQEYRNATPITSLNNVTVPLSEIYFPSVAVCNINQVRQSYFENLTNEVSNEFIDQIYHKYIEGKITNVNLHNNSKC